MNRASTRLSLQEFLALPESDDRYELVEGKLQPKMSPKFKHSKLQLRLLMALNQWCDLYECGQALPEWGVVLQRRGEDWVPVPDLTYVSYKRLPAAWDEDELCPVVPELVVEIISPGQTFEDLAAKATDYLQAGVDRVWVVSTKAQSVTIFRRAELPQTLKAEESIRDPLLPELELPLSRLFARATQGE